MLFPAYCHFQTEKMRIADLKRTMKVRVCVEDNMEDHPQAKGSKFWFVVVVVFVVGVLGRKGGRPTKPSAMQKLCIFQKCLQYTVFSAEINHPWMDLAPWCYNFHEHYIVF